MHQFHQQQVKRRKNLTAFWLKTQFCLSKYTRTKNTLDNSTQAVNSQVKHAFV